MLFFRYTKQASKNVADTTFKDFIQMSPLIKNKIYIPWLPNWDILAAEKQNAINALFVHWMPAASPYFKIPWWWDPKTACLIQTDFLIFFEQMFIDFPVVDDFFGFTEIDSTLISTSECSLLISKISCCKVLLDLSLKNLNKNSLTAALEKNSNREAFLFETCWPSLIQPSASKTKMGFLFHMKAKLYPAKWRKDYPL